MRSLHLAICNCFNALSGLLQVCQGALQLLHTLLLGSPDLARTHLGAFLPDVVRPGLSTLRKNCQRQDAVATQSCDIVHRLLPTKAHGGNTCTDDLLAEPAISLRAGRWRQPLRTARSPPAGLHLNQVAGWSACVLMKPGAWARRWATGRAAGWVALGAGPPARRADLGALQLVGKFCDEVHSSALPVARLCRLLVA